RLYVDGDFLDPVDMRRCLKRKAEILEREGRRRDIRWTARDRPSAADGAAAGDGNPRNVADGRPCTAEWTADAERARHALRDSRNCLRAESVDAAERACRSLAHQERTAGDGQGTGARGAEVIEYLEGDDACSAAA